MTAARDSIASATYALFALEQPISLVELAAAARDSRFPLAATLTPGWFAAAAHEDYSLLDTAPELLVLSTDLDSVASVDVSGIDLIHVYAPELADPSASRISEPTPVPVASAEPVPVASPEMPSTSTQLGLLRELSNLDG